VRDALDKYSQSGLCSTIDIVGATPAITRNRSNNHQSAPSLSLKQICRSQAPSGGRIEIDPQNLFSVFYIAFRRVLIAENAIGKDNVIDTTDLVNETLQLTGCVIWRCEIADSNLNTPCTPALQVS